MEISRFKVLISALLAFVLCAGVVWAEPYFSIEGQDEWRDALYSTQKGARSLRPLTEAQGYDYLMQWERYLEEGEPYPMTEFRTSELYVYEGGGTGSPYPEDAGLVMAWGDPDMSRGEYAGAFIYDYGLDPDLSNATIQITVVAPQFDMNGNQINTVSLGMQDVNGNIRSWHWSCGTAASFIQWGIPTTITINTSMTGVMAATPPATGYANNPFFDITKVQSIIVDENATWVGGSTPVPPPGTTIARPWNYWNNLSVTPNPTGGPIVAGINIDIHQDIQRTDVNDFHIEGRIESGSPVGVPGGGGWSKPPVLVNHIDDIFPNFRITIDKDLTDPAENWYIIKADWWTDTPIPYCTILHLGLEFEATCHNVIIDIVGWWTSNGRKIPDSTNGGHVPIPGFRVEDRIAGAPGHEPQSLRLQNGDADGEPEPGEISTKLVEMQLVGMTPIEVREKLGPEPFKELRVGGLVEHLEWRRVLDPSGAPIGPDNPHDFPADSFFDVFFDIDVEGGLTLNAGDILIMRQLQHFINNSGEQDFRWVYEIHEAHEGESDLGDAPDSTNNFGVAMTAYPWGVQANYPTVYLTGSPPHGPIHTAPTAVAHLGQMVTQEWEADIGFDQDPTNNILPRNNQANRDLADDGLLNLPLKMPHCIQSKFKYLVNVITPNVTLYFNAWADFNRDGDWDDSFNCPDGTTVSEWIVRNQVLMGLPVGITTITTPPYMSWHPAGVAGASSDTQPIWLRITLAENRWSGSGSGGSGPPGGNTYGETEDYYFTPKVEGCDCMDFNLDGIVNFRDFAKFANSWLTSCP